MDTQENRIAEIGPIPLTETTVLELCRGHERLRLRWLHNLTSPATGTYLLSFRGPSAFVVAGPGLHRGALMGEPLWVVVMREDGSPANVWHGDASIQVRVRPGRDGGPVVRLSDPDRAFVVMEGY